MRRLLLMVATVATVVTASAQTANIENFGQINIAAEPNDYFELFASLSSTTAEQAYDRYVGEFINIDESSPVFSSGSSSDDNLYASRLRMMATEVQLPYNDVVRGYIRTYTRQGGTMESVLSMGRYYFPIFEEALYRNGLPMELKMLPVIESALIPAAKSHAAAIGLWQLMMPTAKYYGLEINSFVDERQDPRKSTEAACRYLKDLYKSYKDWTLVIAAYNCGPGNVNKAIKRAGSVGTYWDIWEYLPRETRGHVPAFIGASYGYTFYKAHNLNIREPKHTLAVDTVIIHRMMHLEQVSSTIDVSLDVLRALNPQYRIDVVPAIDKSYTLVLPEQMVGQFIDHENEIYSKDAVYLQKYLQMDNLSSKQAENLAAKVAPAYPKGKTTYKVRSGDTLGAIALKYGVKVSEIQKWNSLSGTNIRPGQNIVMYPK